MGIIFPNPAVIVSDRIPIADDAFSLGKGAFRLKEIDVVTLTAGTVAPGSGGVALLNDVFLTGADATAGTINLLKVDSGNNTIINSKTGEDVHVQHGGSDSWKFLSDGDLQSESAIAEIHLSTLNGFDTGVLHLGGGGDAISGGRGGLLALYGADHASLPGQVRIFSSDGAPVRLVSGSGIFEIDSFGSWTGGGTSGIFISTDTLDGFDNKRLNLTGAGGGIGTDRGASIVAHGNEHAGSPGELHLKAGDTGFIDVQSPIQGLPGETVEDIVTTTDATLTTIVTIAIPEGTTLVFDTLVLANGVAGKNYWAKLTGGARRTLAGSAVLVGTPVPIEDDEGSSGYAVSATTSGNNLLIQVTGAVAETVAWKSFTSKVAR